MADTIIRMDCDGYFVELIRASPGPGGQVRTHIKIVETSTNSTTSVFSVEDAELVECAHLIIKQYGGVHD